MHTNRILDSLPQAERSVLDRILTRLVLKQNQVLFDVRDEISGIYFPCDSIVSLVVPLREGSAIVTSIIGHDGVVGASALSDCQMSATRAVTQVEGECLRGEVNALHAVLGSCPTLRIMLGRHEHALFAEAQQSSACHLVHTLERRLARCLLRISDVSGSRTVDMTQEHLAQMLGVRRSSLSVVAHGLQAEGFMKFRRGHIEISNIEGLNAMACECYGAIKLHYNLLHECWIPQGRRDVAGDDLDPFRCRPS
jgi:CRP-like cAMP-binding protein